MRGKRTIKTLIVLALVTVGVMAVNASAAQAKWVLRSNGNQVLDLRLLLFYGLVEFAVPGLGIEIHCQEGIGTALLHLNAGPNPPAHTVLLWLHIAVFFGCVVLGFEKTCTVKSVGEGAGKIKLSGEGTGAMSGTTTFGKTTSSNFGTVVIEGALCPLNEVEASFSGTLKHTILSPTTESSSHEIEMDDEGLFFGEEKASIKGVVKGTAKEETGNTWSVGLEGL